MECTCEFQKNNGMHESGIFFTKHSKKSEIEKVGG